MGCFLGGDGWMDKYGYGHGYVMGLLTAVDGEEIRRTLKPVEVGTVVGIR